MRNFLFLFAWLACIPMILYRPWTGILAWSWIGYMNPHMLAWGFVRSLPVASVIGLTTLVALVFTRDRKGVPWTPEMVILLLLAIHFTITTYFAWYPDYAWMQWDKVMKILLFTFITTMLIYGKERIHALLMVIALCIGFFGFKGGLFSIMTGGAHRVYGPGASFIGDNNSLGLAMIMVLPLLIFLAREENRAWLRKLLYVTAGLTVIAIIFTYSRGAYLGLASITPFLFLKFKRKFLALVLLIPVVLVGMTLIPASVYERAGMIRTYDEDASAMGRLQAWEAAYHIANASPLVGGGFGNWRAKDLWMMYADPAKLWGHIQPRPTHSIYFDIIGDHGWVGFAMFASLLLLTLQRLRRLQRQALWLPQAAWIRNYALCLQISLIGYMTTGTFLSLAYFDLFYAIVALTAILDREMREAVAKEPAKTFAQQRLEGTLSNKMKTEPYLKPLKT